MEPNLNAPSENKATTPGQTSNGAQNAGSPPISKQAPQQSGEKTPPVASNPGSQDSPNNKGQPHASWQAAAARADNAQGSSINEEQFRAELSDLLREMEVLIGRAGTLSRDALQASKDQLMEKVQNIKNQLNEYGEKTSESTQRTMQIAQAYVRTKPLKAVAIALGIGAFFGLMLNRHRN